MITDWRTVPLGKVVRYRKEFIEINDLETYKRCRVQLHAKGIVLRDAVLGAQIKTKKQQVCRAGDFLVAEIDAKVGGFGIVPESLGDAIVSSHYYLFNVDDSILNKRFLDYFIRTPTFREQVRAQGSTNYAAIRPQDVLTYTMPLPPLDEQQRIVRRVEELSVKIEEARGLRRQSVEEAKLLMGSMLQGLLEDIPRSNWVPLSRYIQEIENGLSPACENRPASDGEWGVVKVGAVSFGVFNPRQNKALPSSLSPLSCYEIHSGDFLMSRANTTELVGACALVEETRPKLMLSDKIFRFIFRKDAPLERRYLNYVLKSPALRSQIEKKATGTSPTMKNISKEKVLRLEVPPHSIFDQQRIVAQLDSAQSRVQSLKRLQVETSEELNALLPSVLDKAFKGEL